MLNNKMRCSKCGRIFPLFNNELKLYKTYSDWVLICKDCLNKEDKFNYSFNTKLNEKFNLDSYIKNFKEEEIN